MREIPEPEQEEWIARLRERARLDAAELVPRPAFLLYGLLAPDLGQGAMAEAAKVKEDVPSRAAQQAWARYWNGRLSLAGTEEDQARQALREVHEGLQPSWLDAWRAWTQGR